MDGDTTPRWQAIGVLLRPPVLPTVFPVRERRILYALKQRHYAGFADHQMPHAHEFFAPMDALMGKNSAENPELQALLRRASLSSNFMR